jgi:FkbM family methyltransferase
MGYSKVIFSMASRWPGLFRPAVSAVLSMYPYRSGEPHWVLSDLKELLGVRVSRRMEVDGLVIHADPFDGPGRKFWSVGLTEPEMLNLLSRVLSVGMVMFDVGAYVGQFSLVASRACKGQITILAFEPTPQVFEQLQENIEANNCKGVKCIQAALSDKPGQAKFYIYPESHDQNSLRPLASRDARSVDVTVETIDSICEQQNLTRLDFVKIDVEGNELGVLKGAVQTLARFHPLLTVEISRHQQAYGYSGAELRITLDAAGYDVYRVETFPCQPYIPVDGEINDKVSHFNILAVPRNAIVRSLLARQGVLAANSV